MKTYMFSFYTYLVQVLQISMKLQILYGPFLIKTIPCDKACMVKAFIYFRHQKLNISSVSFRFPTDIKQFFL